MTPLGLTEVKPDDDAFDMFTGEGDIDSARRQGRVTYCCAVISWRVREEEQANWDDTDWSLQEARETIDRYRRLGVVGGASSPSLKARDEAEKKRTNRATSP